MDGIIVKWKFRHPAHYLAGGITGWIGMDNPILALVLIIGFLGYEIWQAYRLEDKGYLDIIEFVVAMFIVATGLQIWKVMS